MSRHTEFYLIYELTVSEKNLCAITPYSSDELRSYMFIMKHTLKNTDII